MLNVMVRNINALGLLGIAFILGIGLVMQVVLDELPCPLCLLQRIGFALLMYGFMLNIVIGQRFSHYGVIVFAALFGAMASLRQISLHVIPGSGTYGSAVFGYHLYTWSFLLFTATLLAVGVLLMLSRMPDMDIDGTVKMNLLERSACWIAVVTVALNVIATFLECGPLVCADNPVDYVMLKSLG
jgi:disulfide bond formation protein DsbB